MTENAHVASDPLSADDTRLQAVQLLCFFEFRYLPQLYAQTLQKAFPNASEALRVASIGWHDEWETIVAPGGKYAPLQSAKALELFEWMNRYSVTMSVIASQYYPERNWLVCDDNFREMTESQKKRYLHRYAHFSSLRETAPDVLDRLYDKLIGLHTTMPI